MQQSIQAHVHKKVRLQRTFQENYNLKVKSTARSDSRISEGPLAAVCILLFSTVTELDRGRGDSGPETKDTEHPRGDPRLTHRAGP